MKKLPSVERLRECYSYDPNTGQLTQKQHGRGSWDGSTVSDKTNKVEIDGERYIKYRVIWKLYYGEEPPPKIDHEDRDKRNNRIGNLRAATTSQNSANSKVQRNSKTGLKGVHFYPKRKKPYWAYIRHNGRLYSLGYFHNKEDAHEAYCSKGRELHGEFFCAG